jgi:NAD(P)-dependent dehydrogenase (short-subunit alcohol dehydrogenase family)
VVDRFRLDGKIAVVTGASQNIGLEISRAFAQSGAIVVMVARRSDVVKARATEIEAETLARVIPFAGDVMNPEDVAHLAEFVQEEFPQIDVLVNNAYTSGNTFSMAPLEIPDEEWRINFEGNVLAPYRMVRTFGPRMAEGRGGSVINVLSGSGFQVAGPINPYGSSKAGLWMQTRYLAAQCAPKIRVNGLCPGITTSETGGPELTDPIKALVAQSPMMRAGDPTEVAAGAVFLASDAGSYTTGELLFVNGGRPW